MERHNQNAMEIAKFLEAHPKVGKMNFWLQILGK